MKLKLFLTVFFFSAISLYANNLRISGGQRIGNNQVSFILSWENSWYVGGAPSNHDAVWVFIKYRECGSTGEYTHALLSTNMNLHTFSSEITYATEISLKNRFGLDPATSTETNGLGNNTGVMIRRKNMGEGNISNATVTLTLAGTDPFDSSKSYDIKVIGIEMVEIKESAYYLGDNRVNTNSFSLTVISSETPINQHTLVANHATIPQEFPKGYKSFYCMKYEITQGQYTKFAETGGGMTTTEPSLYAGITRNYFSVSSASFPDRAQNFLNWRNLTAYLDWACLRPMSELEYEKVCRGSAVVQPANCYAWGTINYQRILYVSGTEDGTETASTTGANCHCYEPFPHLFESGVYPPESQDAWHYSYSMTVQRFSAISAPACEAVPPTYPVTASVYWVYKCYSPILMCGSANSMGWGPVGAGIFARNATENRESSGASYYGVMEMSGNMVEQCVDIVSTGYLGTWGNGYLIAGEADVADWPGAAAARCLRGGGYGLPAVNMRICDRQYNNNTSDARGPITGSVWRQGTVGGRGVR